MMAQGADDDWCGESWLVPENGRRWLMIFVSDGCLLQGFTLVGSWSIDVSTTSIMVNPLVLEEPVVQDQLIMEF